MNRSGISTLFESNEQLLLKNYRDTGDLSYLGKLYQDHSEMVYYVCLRYFQDSERSRDAVMDIFEELVTKVNKQEIQSFAKWLYVLSRNHCLMILRASKHQQHISLDEFVEFPFDMHQDTNVENREQKLTVLEQCLDKLPEKQKKSIDLFFLNEKCYYEVSDITGYSLKEVKSYIQNGKRNLKNCMEAAHEHE
ncbi:RNA polymerase sigma factor [Sphingobacterium sp. SYP-B4668]|uniref:RNA polymerase sigma factor n=1 Tax=Sphingobacterium sp. SYP-B4668 TaxID=2996035 RepID=UPI0022DD2675|nr:sigma-70 family RNA polymerase sigma factor [Sphingobacterium sp. SYP-B4668]